MAMEDCPFCVIVEAYPHPFQPQREVDPSAYSHVVFSTPHVLAFLDRLPLTRCHTLLIARDHHQLLTDIPSDVAAEIGRALPVVCRAVVEVSKSDGFNIIQNNGVSAGQVVPHSHFHIVPRYREFTNATIFGKGDRRELEDDEGEDISRRMREVVERESSNCCAKL